VAERDREWKGGGKKKGREKSPHSWDQSHTTHAKVKDVGDGKLKSIAPSPKKRFR